MVVDLAIVHGWFPVSIRHRQLLNRVLAEERGKSNQEETWHEWSKHERDKDDSEDVRVLVVDEKFGPRVDLNELLNRVAVRLIVVTGGE